MNGASVGSACIRCPDCGQIFGTRQAKVCHQMASAEPYGASWPPEPTWPTFPAAGGNGAAALSPPTAGHQFAPKHGVRVLRSMLEVSMVMPMLVAEPVVALDLEGDLTPASADCAIDLLQIYLPVADVVLLVHAISLPRQPLAEMLSPWMSSTAHAKVLCDARADADALHHLYGIRLAGVVDVQICHAAAVGELHKYAAGAMAMADEANFTLPTGLSRLTSTYCSSELSAPMTALKADFGALFDAGRAPFRALPLSAAAATYAAADVWHVYLVYEALWPALQTAGLAVQVALASDSRAGEFRDVPGGRQRWEAAVARFRANKSPARKNAGLGAFLPTKGPAPAPLPVAVAPLPVAVQASTAATTAPAPAPAAQTAGTVVGEPAAAAVVAAPAKKPRKVSGPMCVCCDVNFSGEAQLEEHRKGKRHCIAQAAYDRPTPPTLAVECRQAPMEQTALNQAFEQYGPLASATLQQSAPAGTAPRQMPQGVAGPWFATVVYRNSADAAKALGQRYLYVGGKRVYVEVV